MKSKEMKELENIIDKMPITISEKLVLRVLVEMKGCIQVMKPTKINNLKEWNDFFNYSENKEVFFKMTNDAAVKLSVDYNKENYEDWMYFNPKNLESQRVKK